MIPFLLLTLPLFSCLRESISKTPFSYLQYASGQKLNPHRPKLNLITEAQDLLVGWELRIGPWLNIRNARVILDKTLNQRKLKVRVSSLLGKRTVWESLPLLPWLSSIVNAKRSPPLHYSYGLQGGASIILLPAFLWSHYLPHTGNEAKSNMYFSQVHQRWEWLIIQVVSKSSIYTKCTRRNISTLHLQFKKCPRLTLLPFSYPLLTLSPGKMAE